MAEIKIDLDKLASDAVELKSLAEKIESAVKKEDKELKNINTIYDSKNTEEIKKKYSQLKGWALDLKKALINYSDYLIDTKNLYKKVEIIIDKKADEIGKSVISKGLADEWK